MNESSTTARFIDQLTPRNTVEFFRGIQRGNFEKKSQHYLDKHKTVTSSTNLVT